MNTQTDKIREALEREIESHGDRMQMAVDSRLREDLINRREKCRAAIAALEAPEPAQPKGELTYVMSKDLVEAGNAMAKELRIHYGRQSPGINQIIGQWNKATATSSFPGRPTYMMSTDYEALYDLMDSAKLADGQFWQYIGVMQYVGVTHWMPLPAPPQTHDPK